MNTRTFIIAEAGVNHNGRLDLALQLVDAAKAAGADAVKFQTFRAEDVVTPDAATADYQKSNTGATNQFDMIRALELDDAAHLAVAAHCALIGIEFCSTPFSESAVDLLVSLQVRRLKLPSGELTNRPLLEHAARTGLPLLLSTGMATLEEVRQALGWIAAVWKLTLADLPATGKLVVLHCTSAYPAPDSSLNLRALQTLAAATGLPVGYSDHSLGSTASIAAVAMGAAVIEKHLTLDPSMPGPDHKASATPESLAELVRAVRQIEAMRGDGIKRPQAVEANTREVARRSVVLIHARPAGHALQAQDLALRRPGTGIAPSEMASVYGAILLQDTAAHRVLHWPLLRRKDVDA
mgnify:CR=1 FL=1